MYREVEENLSLSLSLSLSIDRSIEFANGRSIPHKPIKMDPPLALEKHILRVDLSSGGEKGLAGASTLARKKNNPSPTQQYL